MESAGKKPKGSHNMHILSFTILDGDVVKQASMYTNISDVYIINSTDIHVVVTSEENETLAEGMKESLAKKLTD